MTKEKMGFQFPNLRNFPRKKKIENIRRNKFSGLETGVKI